MIYLEEGLVDRVIQCLQDWMPAELAAIDAEQNALGKWAGPTPVIPNGNYYPQDRPLIWSLPAITVHASGSATTDAKVLQVQGGRLDTRTRLTVGAHHQIQSNQGVPSLDENTMKRIAWRYASAIRRILLLKKPGLETVADANLYANSCVVSPDGEATFVDPDQGIGEEVFSVKVPLAAEYKEALT